jgi:hypothetical protein
MRVWGWLWRGKASVTQSSGADPAPIGARREMLSAYLDGELNDLDIARIEEDLASDSSLSAEFEDLRVLRGALLTLDELPVPRPFTLDAESVSPRSSLGRLELFSRMGAVAAAFALVVVLASDMVLLDHEGLSFQSPKQVELGSLTLSQTDGVAGGLVATQPNAVVKVMNDGDATASESTPVRVVPAGLGGSKSATESRNSALKGHATSETNVSDGQDSVTAGVNPESSVVKSPEANRPTSNVISERLSAGQRLEEKAKTISADAITPQAEDENDAVSRGKDVPAAISDREWILRIVELGLLAVAGGFTGLALLKWMVRSHGSRI